MLIENIYKWRRWCIMTNCVEKPCYVGNTDWNLTYLNVPNSYTICENNE